MKRLPILVATAVLLAACMTAAQKKDRANAEAAIKAATAQLEAVKNSSAGARSPVELRSAETDLKTAKSKFAAGQFLESRNYAQLVTQTAAEMRRSAETEHMISRPMQTTPGRKKTKSRTNR